MTFEDIKTACGVLFTLGQVAEVRALGKWGTASGYFNDYEKLAGAVQVLENKGEYAGIYVSLNPVNPDLLARRANRIETRLSKSDSTSGDVDIISRRWLPIDIDPVRPSGVSSSDEEHKAAICKAVHIADYLLDLGWPDPVYADSGNGAHLLYRMDLPNNESSRDLIKAVLGTLDTIFSDSGCNVDTANFNAARIWKLYGTTSRKGDNVANRPHRQAKILRVPDEIHVVPAELLSSLANLFPKEEPKPTFRDKKRGETIVLRDWLNTYGIGYEEKPYSGGSLFVLDECPFSSAHKDGAYAIQFPNGAIFAGCHHNSCGSSSQRWPELREKFEGTVEEWIRKNRLRPREEDEGEGASEASPPLASDAVSEMKKETLLVLNEGDPLGYMLDTFALDHIGDPVVAECLVMSLASRLVINAKGLHVSVTGESGKGKSHTFDTMMQQVPEDLRLEGRMSDKALFYIKDLKPGSVIALDDVTLSDQMQEVLKGVTTSFKKPFKYRTVDKDRGGKTCIIPQRCVWWVAKVDGTGDDQVWNRMLTCWIDDSEEQDAKVLAQTLTEAAMVPSSGTRTRPELEICKGIWRTLTPVWVVVPFAERIRFSSSMNRRNPDMLLDLVKAHAVLMQNQRERSQADDVSYITATVEDFRQACWLYTALNGKSGGQQTKLTKSEYELMEAIQEYGRAEITISELQHITTKSRSVVYKMLHGTNSKGYHYSGLLEKCPAISVCDRTLVTDENGTTLAHRREKAYAWDEFVFQSWSSDGGCWLVSEGSNQNNSPPSPPSDDVAEKEPISGRGGKVAEISATKIPPETGSKGENLSNKNSVCTHGGKSENVQHGISDQVPAHDHMYNPDFSATSDQDMPSGKNMQPVSESEEIQSGGKFRNLSATSPEFPPGDDLSLSHPGASRGLASLGPSHLSIREIKVGDYIEIEKGFGPGSCDCCGSKWVNYQERMSFERLSGPPRLNRKICKKCYEIAKRAESSPFRVLPGILNPVLMTRLSVDLGKCQVCDNQKAVWQDPETKTAICEICYQNLPRTKGTASNGGTV